MSCLLRSLSKACLLLTLGLLASATWAAGDLKAAGGDAPVQIVCAAAAPEREMAQFLIRFLQDRHQAVQPEIAPAVRDDYAGPQWVLGTLESFASLKAGGDAPQFAAGSREEAFSLEAQSGPGGVRIVLIGKSAAGLRAGTARLLAKLANDGQALWIAPGVEQHDPFIPLRILTVSNAARRQAPMSSPFREADCQTWSQERLTAYPELFWQLGYNGMQVDEDRGYGSVKGEDLKRIQRALKAMMRGARQYHLYVSLSQWGDCLFIEGEALSWNDPQQHQVMQAFMKELAGEYGALVDNITIRVGDPGGCTRDGCDFYKTPQQLTAAFLAAFRQVNPKVSGTLSLWANSAFWKYSPRKLNFSNYVPFPDMINQQEYGLPLADGAKFLDATDMPLDVSIAMHRSYNADQAETILAAGRVVDIKCWYVADMEMIDNICINMATPDLLLSAMPAKARDQVRSQAIELCFDGWPQIIGQYIAAQKLWDPKRPLDEIKKEFCTATFGPQNAEAMVAVYNACENGDPNTTARPIPAPADFGTAAYNARLRAVLDQAEKVKLPTGWKSNFAIPVPTQKYVDMLQARLRLILAVSEAKQKVDTARQAGADQEAIARLKHEAIQNLPVLPIDPLYRQDATIVDQTYRSITFAEMIERL